MSNIPKVSVVVPVFNERDSLNPLYEEIHQALRTLTHEVIFIDDGSTDGSIEILEKLAHQNPSVRIVIFTRNFGQTAALSAGFQESQGEIIVTLDADGQNDPGDIPQLVQLVTDNCDMASGWRRSRKDPFLTRRLPSVIANVIISKVTRVPLHDFGCTLKAYRRSILDNLRLYGEMHRLLPAWCAWQGARILEVEVNHRPRTTGKSKYGIGRTFKVLLDLLTTRFISGYFANPSYLFGGMGLLFYFWSTVSVSIVFYDKLGPDRWAPFRIPLLLLGVFLGIIGTLLLMLGLLAELLVRLFYEVTEKSPYKVRRVINGS